MPAIRGADASVETGRRALAPLEPADLPPKRQSFWQLAGPGAILVGLSIGAGEIIVWPRIAAQFGATMVWAALLGLVLQLWVNFEIGRWTIATGESVYTGYARIWRGFSVVFILFNVLGWLAPGWARASGLALKALLVGPEGWGSGTAWTAITFAAVALLLFGPRLVYRTVELTIEVLVVIVVVGLILVAAVVGTPEHWGEMLRGAANFGYRDPGLTVKELFIALVFAGAGGTANLFYSFYLRDKHVGMGARIPEMVNELRRRPEAVPTTGFTFPDTEENRDRFREWFSHVKKDQVLFFWALNTLTILLFIFGAVAVLHPAGIVPEQGRLIWDEAAILGRLWGQPGRVIFLLVGVATLFSTQLAIVDGVARSIADIVCLNFPRARKRGVSHWYLMVAAAWIVAGTLITWVMEQRQVSELGFLFNAAYMGGFAMAVYVPLTLYMNHRLLPRSARPGVVCTAANLVAAIVYVGFAVACILWEVQRLLD